MFPDWAVPGELQFVFLRSQEEHWPDEWIERAIQCWNDWQRTRQELTEAWNRYNALLVRLAPPAQIDPDMDPKTRQRLLAGWSAAYQAALASPEALGARAVAEDARRRNSIANQKYWRADDPIRTRERDKRHRVPAMMRRELLADWEASGRICGICGEVVAEGDLIEVHHTVAADVTEKRFLAVTHRGCNRRFGDPLHAGRNRVTVRSICKVDGC